MRRRPGQQEPADARPGGRQAHRPALPGTRPPGAPAHQHVRDVAAAHHFAGTDRRHGIDPAQGDRTDDGRPGARRALEGLRLFALGLRCGVDPRVKPEDDGGEEEAPTCQAVRHAAMSLLPAVLLSYRHPRA
nr:Exonuclease SbcC [Rhizobiaceae bacterium]